MGFMRRSCNGKVSVLRRFSIGLLLLCSGLAVAATIAKSTPAQGTAEVWFSPWDDAEGAIVRALAEARRSIRMQAYLITSRPIAAAMIAAVARGVRVEILADREMATKGANSRLPDLVRGGASVWLETRYAAAHNKVIIIDGEADEVSRGVLTSPIVITGSYNYTWSAQARNAENLLLLRDNFALTKRYLDNWQRHRDEAQVWNDEESK